MEITCYSSVLYGLHISIRSITVGNKCDLENIRAVSIEEGKSLAESEGMFFMETSALDSTNVNQAFEIVIREIYNSVTRKVLNSDSYKAELSVNRVSLMRMMGLSLNVGLPNANDLVGPYSQCGTSRRE
ncbi:Ras-related protein RABA5c [Capsicum chinense]|nr:Ras-related protein RABA5c [Capsicum chinense]